MRAFLLGLLHVAIGGAVVPTLNAICHGNFSPVALGMGAASGAAASLLGYLTPNPAQQSVSATANVVSK